MNRVRPLDRVAAAVGLVVLTPLLVAIAIVVRATSPGPAWHRAVRVGLGGEPFTLYKFRSMVAGSEATGTRVTAAGDPRVTRVGRALRKSKLDELPQLVNVVRGEMGLVGSRPEDPAYVDLDDPLHAELYSYPPGITGPASVIYRHEEDLLAERVASGHDPEDAYRDLARTKMEIDLAYLRDRTLCSDLALLGRTVVSVAGRRPEAIG